MIWFKGYCLLSLKTLSFFSFLQDKNKNEFLPGAQVKNTEKLSLKNLFI